jgi:peptidoglycan hydrolase-like protein with peptidoglycan-binding domain
MNFRDLYSRLDAILEAGVVAPNQQTGEDPRLQDGDAEMKTAGQQPAQPAGIPGQQPSLGPKVAQMSPQQVQAMQYPNQKPTPQGVAPTDPKADINAMSQALQAMSMQGKQQAVQPTTSAGIAQQQATANAPKQITAPKPGEPMEEELDNISENRDAQIAKWQAWYAKNPDKLDRVPASIRDSVSKFADATSSRENIKKSDTPDATSTVEPTAQDTPAPKKRQWASGTLGQGVGMSGTGDVGVVALQQKLKNAGYDLRVDGKFGPETTAAVKKFQKDNNLKVDGAAGPETLPKIMAIDAPANTTAANAEPAPNASTAVVPPNDAQVFGLTANSDDVFKFSPEQEKYLGGANRQDPNIISRMPGQKPPVSYFTNPEDQEIAKNLNQGAKNWQSVKNFFTGKKSTDATAPATTPTNTAPPLVKTDQSQADMFANMSASDLRKHRADQLAAGNEVPDAAINPPPPKNAEVKEKLISLESVVDELDEWSLGDKIHPDVDYSWGDAATDVALTGAGVLATGLTGGAAGPAAAALTGGRAARLGGKVYQAGKNIFTGSKAAATNSAVAKELGAKTAKASAAAIPASAATTHALDKAMPADDVDQTTREELSRIKELMKKV